MAGANCFRQNGEWRLLRKLSSFYSKLVLVVEQNRFRDHLTGRRRGSSIHSSITRGSLSDTSQHGNHSRIAFRTSSRDHIHTKIMCSCEHKECRRGLAIFRELNLQRASIFQHQLATHGQQRGTIQPNSRRILTTAYVTPAYYHQYEITRYLTKACASLQIPWGT